jgi:formylglycine-generating enzyme required for sulfatase activity
VADARYYGESEELLDRHAWYRKNSHNRQMSLPGSFRPNDLGLFDLLGNAEEWCEDPYFYYPSGTRGRPKKDNFSIQYLKNTDNQISRALRGGSFAFDALDVRSAYRSSGAPVLRINCSGFRPARTYP